MAHTMRLVFSIIGLLLASPSLADEVKIYTWESYFSTAVIEQFEKETGHNVTLISFDSEESRDHVITSGRAVGYDLVVIESVALNLLNKQGFIQDLSHTRAQSVSLYDSKFFESCGDGGLPYAWGTAGILYRSGISETPINSWTQLFSPPKEFSKRIVMNEDQIDAIGSALLASGHNPFSESEQDLKDAYAILSTQQQHLAGISVLATSQAVENWPQMAIGLGFSGESYWMNEYSGYDDWVYTVPNEGSMLWLECLASPSSERISSATIQFLEFIQTPDIAAINAEEVWFATPNNKAYTLASEEYQQDNELYPSQEILNKSHVYREISSKSLSLRTRILNALGRL